MSMNINDISGLFKFYLVVTFFLSFWFVASSFKGNEVIIGEGGICYMDDYSWWGLKSDIYPLKLVNGEWFYKENGKWKLIGFDSNDAFYPEYESNEYP
jgi:hypothetical protein